MVDLKNKKFKWGERGWRPPRAANPLAGCILRLGSGSIPTSPLHFANWEVFNFRPGKQGINYRGRLSRQSTKIFDLR